MSGDKASTSLARLESANSAFATKSYILAKLEKCARMEYKFLPYSFLNIFTRHKLKDAYLAIYYLRGLFNYILSVTQTLKSRMK